MTRPDDRQRLPLLCGAFLSVRFPKHATPKPTERERQNPKTPDLTSTNTRTRKPKPEALGNQVSAVLVFRQRPASRDLDGEAACELGTQN